MTLLRFSVENYRSLRDRQELSLVASAAMKDNEQGLIRTTGSMPGAAVPVAVVYGANASGKSNLISAFDFFRAAILNSYRRGDSDSSVPRVSFALDSSKAAAPTTMECDFVLDGTRYAYGFSATDEEFTEEWLYSFPTSRRRVLFERVGSNFTFGRNLQGRNQVIAELTRRNSLFVSAGTQSGHATLTEISRFFRSVKSDNTISIAGFFASQQLAASKLDRRIIEFLGRVETGIVGHRQRELEIPQEQQEFQRAIMEALERISEGKIDLDVERMSKYAKVDLAHRGADGGEIYFDLDDESDGTRRLLIVLAPIFAAIDGGLPIFIDELDASLHTKACEAIIALFSTREINPRGAQLITTTHDTNLLNSRFLRRDQIWFTEKDPTGASHLYPLTDIRTRKGDNLEKGYLQGRYGAIPFSGRVPEFDESA